MTLAFVLVLLVGPWVVAQLRSRFNRTDVDSATAGRLGLVLVFLFTGAGHFLRTSEMIEMLPVWVPMRPALIYSTGVLEISAALGLLSGRWARPIGILLILFLVAAFPSNIYAAFHRIGIGAHTAGPIYLLARGPLQVILILWTYRFAVRPSTGTGCGDWPPAV